MNVDDLRATLERAEPPPDLSPLLQALWFDGHGDWSAAHDIAQEVHSRDAAWVHAYLHRKEGDESNAAYWYRQAARPRCTSSLEEEWDHLVRWLLDP